MNNTGPRTIKGANLRIRELSKQVERLQETVCILKMKLRILHHERTMLAKLAASGPAFDNPLIVFEAKEIRDHVLAGLGLNPDGTFKN